MQYEILATGSSGNCIILNHILALDMGVPFKTVAPCVRSLQAVFISHVHSDHLSRSTVKRLAQERPGLLWLCGPELVGKLKLLGCRRVYEVRLNQYRKFGDLSVMGVQLIHDVPNYGLRILLSGERAFYATDTYSLDGVSAKNYDLYLVEGNHGEEEIQERIQRKLDAGQYCYELRARDVHMSRERALNWLYENMGPNSQYILIHGHEEE